MYCTPTCRHAHTAEARRKPPLQWNCIVCGALVTRTAGPRQGMYCKAHKNSNPRQRANQQRRDAIKRQYPNMPTSRRAERIYKQRIYERDGWICGICHKPVRKDLQYPHPRSASLDHIEALVRRNGDAGGTHTSDNVQLAHLECNVAKGNHQPAQLRLFG